ncbi:zinc finger BED domain-containing protein DAYSLEEPER-like [Glycine soja]|uniref:Zinc finger BED domain-containing protein DAYSLEEPER n=1 Tax=Glycine soja TaxID=3848 RepID=A0A445K411_GLYSO|nr:zinc finger BED domain-containing protein DAYSLEEPER [Glycine max]XP_028234808.1 zinc finger BED domain-containing protein DAYSLEEPER-like [Glycine soja]RZC05574.1 Zinc finger BED domain-containing protein DAYSLEEPER [Glycine soja]|eukprot:XP_014632709.1 zinc finger BED domain-containing protein DAYSLEEPER [Glycine max]
MIKYLGNLSGLNILLLIAVVFDQRYKMEYVNWSINQIFYPSKATNLKEKVEFCLKSLFEEYNGPNGGSLSGSQKTSFNEDGNDDPYSWNQFLQSTGCKSNAKSELDKYLEESVETSSDLDVLNWWKLNSNRFPILANIAREMLAIPVSAVATEYVFNVGGRVLDPYRSSLTPKMLEAHVCLQNWLKGTPFSLFSNEDFEELLKIEQDMVSQQDAAHSAS